MAAMELMKSFHDQGWVHGDLRDANILCDGEKLILVDFDFGGKAEEVSYPMARLQQELYAPCYTSGDLIIRKKNDIQVLRATLAKMA